MIYHNQGKQVNHYTTDAVHVWIMILNTLIFQFSLTQSHN
jgi:hypothetical protein